MSALYVQLHALSFHVFFRNSNMCDFAEFLLVEFSKYDRGFLPVISFVSL